MINENGKFVPDVVLKNDSSSFHILNYNSPGATGALPFSAYVVNHLEEQGLIQNENKDAQCSPWKFSEIIEKNSVSAGRDLNSRSLARTRFMVFNFQARALQAERPRHNISREI